MKASRMYALRRAHADTCAGVDAFYTGSIANNSIAKAQANGGIITLDDLKSKPISQPIWLFVG